MGHALGLPHTFTKNRKCDESKDDGFTDTPLESSPNYWCDKWRDTCPDHAGYDPIWNFMDYSPDICMNRFSTQQINRIGQVLLSYRKKLRTLSIQNFNDLHSPTLQPTANPTMNPTNYPTNLPTNYPTNLPTDYPTNLPTAYPTMNPTSYPTNSPTSSAPSMSPTSAPTSIYDFCDKRNSKNQPSKWFCVREPYKILCLWHDHYQKCYPRSHKNTIMEFCDVRTFKDFSTPSEKFCKKQKYKIKCYWNTEIKQCLPRETPSPTSNPTQNPTHQPTTYPTFIPTVYPTNYPTFNPTRHPTNYPTYKPTKAKGMGMGMGKNKNKNKKDKKDKND